MTRKMVWIKTARMEAWACSECAWTFSPKSPPRGANLDEMKQNFEIQRDREFATHMCGKHPKDKSPRDPFKISR